ncbi:cytochrome c biogenesis CcdA family protein [Rhodobacter maris]|uniref:Cytochrome c biogenesis protein CcdA n=1 Tax=Rhodobacter maris TaxID=446682 RepID=A0A285RFI8_9RHOB|nr:cytochrome c biogenesis protein CcdA [Rhodobacter maris]SOB92449.1 cytochrome c biogenesis protein CcdA [Rhodobacter maris]
MFGIDIIDAAFLPAAFAAFVAGVISFLSPCVLPIVPPYLAYMGGVTVSEMGAGKAAARGRVLMAALFFVLGLSTVFLIIGLGASALGQAMGGARDTLGKVAGVVVMIFGAHFLGIYRIGFLDRELRVDTGDRGGSAFGAYLLGLAFAFGWTPCLGPVLGTIASLAMMEGGIGRGMALLAVYAAGLGLPFLIVAAFFPSLGGAMAFMRRNMGRIEKISGLLLWTVGLFMLTGALSDFSFWILDTFPALAEFG